MGSRLKKRPNKGCVQFVYMHAIMTGNPELRKAYERWEMNCILDTENRRRLSAESEAKGIAKGMAKGMANTQMEMALNAFRKVTQSEFAQTSETLIYLGFSSVTVNEAEKQVRMELGQAGSSADCISSHTQQ